MNHARAAERIDGLIRFFLYVLIFWLPYSPAVIETCVIISLILWAIKRIILLRGAKPRQGILRSFRPGPTVLDAPIGLFLLACLLSVTASAFFAQSLHNFLTKTMEWFIVYYLVVETFKDRRHIFIALGIFVFTACSTAVDSLIQFYITHKDIFLGRVIEPGSRPTAGFKTPNSLGGYLTMVIPFVAAWSLLARQKVYLRLIAFAALVLLFWSLGITLSRGAYLGTFFGFGFLLLTVVFPDKRRHIYEALGLFVAAIVLMMTFALVLTNSPGREVSARYQTIPWRLDLWGDSMRMILDKPLFGHGVNTFMNVYQAYRGNAWMAPTYAHNCYIQLAAEIGMVGLAGFIGIIVVLCHRALAKIMAAHERDRSLAVAGKGLLAGILAFLVHSFFDTNFYSLQLSVYLWYMIGVAVAVCRCADAGCVAPSIGTRNQ